VQQLGQHPASAPVQVAFFLARRGALRYLSMSWFYYLAIGSLVGGQGRVGSSSSSAQHGCASSSAMAASGTRRRPGHSRSGAEVVEHRLPGQRATMTDEASSKPLTREFRWTEGGQV
jgi:hypothetical protein